MKLRIYHDRVKSTRARPVSVYCDPSSAVCKITNTFTSYSLRCRVIIASLHLYSTPCLQSDFLRCSDHEFIVADKMKLKGKFSVDRLP